MFSKSLMYWPRSVDGQLDMSSQCLATIIGDTLSSHRLNDLTLPIEALNRSVDLLGFNTVRFALYDSRWA